MIPARRPSRVAAPNPARIVVSWLFDRENWSGGGPNRGVKSVPPCTVVPFGTADSSMNAFSTSIGRTITTTVRIRAPAFRQTIFMPDVEHFAEGERAKLRERFPLWCRHAQVRSSTGSRAAVQPD